MPTYEYRCTECRSEFERFQKMSDAHIDECPECEGKVQRLISKGGGILFKGTGFYATDYRSGSPPSETTKSDETTKSETSTAKKKSSDKSGNGTKKE